MYTSLCQFEQIIKTNVKVPQDKLTLQKKIYLRVCFGIALQCPANSTRMRNKAKSSRHLLVSSIITLFALSSDWFIALFTSVLDRVPTPISP